MDFVWLGRVWTIWAGCRHGTEDQLAVLFTCTNSTGRGSGPVHSAISIFLFWSNFNGAERSSGGLDTENKRFEMWGMLKFADKWASLAAVWSYDMANYQRIQQTVCWTVSTSDMENICLGNNEGTQTQRSEEIQEAFADTLLQILHTSQELV